MIATNGKWTEHKFDMKVRKLSCRCAGFVESFWFDRNFAYFLLWKLTNFDKWKCVSLLWEMNSRNHCFSLPKVYIHGWYSWFFPCVHELFLPFHSILVFGVLYRWDHNCHWKIRCASNARVNLPHIGK
jgi:hypothetical protein